jgi:putative transposase
MIGDIAHVFNRGVDKRKIFLDDSDRLRFIEALYVLNNKEGKLRTIKNMFDENSVPPKQDKLVEILKWVIMPNHYHLLVHEVSEGGIVEFTKRLGNSYTKYFNTKYKGRSGYLFQNSAKMKILADNRHFLYIPFYIDLNPVKVKRGRNTLDSLMEYKWSNFRTFYRKEKFSIISDANKFYELFDTNQKRYEKELLDLSTWQVDEWEKYVDARAL